MKISFKNKLHNCDKHLVKDSWTEEGYVVERLEYCSICGRVKNHISYGANYVINYKEKTFTPPFKFRRKRSKDKECHL